MIRTHIHPCRLPRERADDLNRRSGTISTCVLVQHWRVWRQGSRHWLSEKAGTFLSDKRIREQSVTTGMHSHSIDAAQQGFSKACVTTRALRKAGFTEAQFPHWTKRFRTTIWKNTGVQREGDVLKLSGGGRTKKEREANTITVPIPNRLRDCLRFLEVRLVYDATSTTQVVRLCRKPGLTRPPAERPVTNPGEIGTCEGRLSSLLSGSRLNSPPREGQCFECSNLRRSGREEVGAGSWSQGLGDASLPHGRDGAFSRPTLVPPGSSRDAPVFLLQRVHAAPPLPLKWRGIRREEV